METREKYGIVSMTVLGVFFAFLADTYDNKQSDDFISQCKSIEKQLNGTILYKTSDKCYIKNGDDVIKIER